MANEKDVQTPQAAPVQTETVAAPVKKAAPKLLLPCILGAVVVLLVVAGIVFRVIVTSPKHVFANAINDVYKKVGTVLDTADEKFKIDENPVVFQGTIKLDSNIEELNDMEFKLSDLELSGLLGLDLKREELELEVGAKGKKDKVSLKAFFQDNIAYMKTSFYDKVIKAEEAADIDFSEITKAMDEIEVDPELYNNILEAFTKAFADALDKDSMSKEGTEYEVLDKEVKVTKYTYKLNDKTVKKLVKNTASNLLDDKDFIKDVAKAANVEKDEVKDMLKQLKESSEELTMPVKFELNVYTKGLSNDIVGLDVEVEKEKLFYWYTNGDNVEAEINSGKDKIRLTVEEDGKERKGKLVYNDQKIATATIREFEEHNYDFDFEINLSEIESSLKNVTGTVLLKTKETKKDLTGEYSLKVEYDGKYVKASGTFGIESKSKLDGLKTSDAISENDVDEEELLKKFQEAVENDEVLKSLYDAFVTEMEEEEIESKLNYNDMVTSTSSEVKNLLTKERATVIFVGNSYYSTYSASAAHDMLENLMDAQDDLEFHSYTIEPYSVDTDLKTELDKIEYVCEGNKTQEIEEVPTTPEDGIGNVTTPTEQLPSTCADYPAIILVKGGKVVKAFRGTVTYDNLVDELKKLGL